MNMKKLRLFAVLIIAAMALTMLAGCQPGATTAAPTSAPTEGSSAETTPASTEITLPLTTEDVTFSIFMPINRVEQDYNNNEVWKEITNRTGIKFEWECPTTDTANERLTLILSSQELPDLIDTAVGGSGASYPGGLEVAVDDGAFLDLKAMLPEFAPNYWKYLTENPAAMRDVLTDKGYIPAIYEIVQKDTEINTGIWSVMTRGDWLTDLGLEVPETIDDWHTVLTAYKEEKGATFPLLWSLGMNPVWMQAWGIGLTPFTTTGSAAMNMFYPDANGTIHYGAVEQGFEDYLKTFSQWYQEGLYDRDFTTRQIYDLPGAATLIANGDAGVMSGWVSWSGMLYGNNAALETPDEDFKIVTTPSPVLEKGGKSTMVSTKAEFLGYSTLSITSQCENPQLFLQLVNYLSSEEGQILTNYGIEDNHYTMVNGQPTFTDKILKDTMGVFDAHEVIVGNYNFVNLIGTSNMMNQVYDEATLAAVAVPSQNTNVTYMYYQLNEDEATELGDIFGDINTYVAAEYSAAIMDPAKAAEWMEVQAAQIKTMGIDRAIEICQGAYDRYLARK